MSVRRDAVVVGGGPGGAMAARELARAGRDVLLVERAAFPRFKVCGGCLTGGAMAALEAAGLGALPEQRGGRSFERLKLMWRGHEAELELVPGVALSRERFDEALLDEARASGAEILLATGARVGPVGAFGREVRLSHDDGEETVIARVVLMATGLSGAGMPAGEGFELDVAEGSRLGAGTIVESVPEHFPAGAIVMAVDRSGYVGMVGLEGSRLGVAGAFDSGLVRAEGGLGGAAKAVLDAAGGPQIPGLGDATWKGTPPLTVRRRRLAAERLLVIGDAAGFIEPFTGEGMSWAMTAALAAAPLAIDGVSAWTSDIERLWERRWAVSVGRRQRQCRLLSRSLRHVTVMAAAIRLLGWAPSLARPAVRWFGSRRAGAGEA